MNLDLVPKSCKICCKPGGLEDKGPKTESGFCPKSCKNISKLGSLEDQDPISKISKLILHRGLEAFVDICIHLFHPFF